MKEKTKYVGTVSVITDIVNVYVQ